jgi:4'-phosphopantetheinyl transferase
VRLIKNSLENPASPNSVGLNDLPGSLLTLTADEVHVWHANLDDHVADHFRPCLAEDEVARADRFHFARDRNHYVVARGLLRKLLAAYLGIDAAELQFTYAQKGKPSLATSHKSGVNFNLAHSQARAIFAFSQGREIGVDLEFMREDLEAEKIAERFFSAREIEKLRTVPAELRKQAFFNCWTRKEAYIKARGEGLSLPLDEFDVSLLPGEAAGLLRNYKEPSEVGRWTMQAVSVPDGYVAALVAEGRDWRLKSFEVEQLFL